MFKSMMLAAVATTAALIAGTAGAADLRVTNSANPAVHIPVAGKSSAQLQAEISAAANTVCGSIDTDCQRTATDDANAQLSAILRSARLAANPAAKADVDVARAGPSTIHVALAGKSRSQIDADVKAAAQTVCKAAEGVEFTSCVSDAIRDANAQLRYLAWVEQPRKLASN